MKIESRLKLPFWQAAALREERHAAQQRREAAMHAQGGFSLDAILLSNQSWNQLSLMYWFPSSCSYTHLYHIINNRSKQYKHDKHIMFFLWKNLCVSPDPFWAQTCRFPADPKSGPPAPERRSPLRNEFCRAACVRLSHLQRILRKVEHLPEPCQQYGFLALKGLARIRIITFVRFGAPKS